MKLEQISNGGIDSIQSDKVSRDNIDVILHRQPTESYPLGRLETIYNNLDMDFHPVNLPGIKLLYIGYLPMLPVQAYWYLYLIFFYLYTLLKLSYQRPEKI